ncbi:MAG: DMT family transporter [Parachlamydiaceae bacterium]|nr:DMT family transporter [Parachlamydiaceae bacterium]
MLKGTLYALAACFLWGLIFVVPTLMQGFDPIEIALGRHSVYGIISVLFLLFSYKKFAHYSLKNWFRALVFALVISIFYYSCVVTGVSCASPALTALILGMSPIVISFYGNWLEKECHFKDLIVPTLLILVGLLLVNIPTLQDQQDKPFYWYGALSAFGALLAWSWYVVANARFLKRNPQVNPNEWTTMIGVGTFCWVVSLGTLYEIWQGGANWQKFIISSEFLHHYIFGCLVLGILCSWIGAYLWNNASMLLPVSLAGQLTIFETLFGLLFFYILDQKMPPYLEILGTLLMVSGVMYSLRTSTASSNVAIE